MIHWLYWRVNLSTIHWQHFSWPAKLAHHLKKRETSGQIHQWQGEWWRLGGWRDILWMRTLILLTTVCSNGLCCKWSPHTRSTTHFWASIRIPVPPAPDNETNAIVDALNKFLTKMKEADHWFMVFPHNVFKYGTWQAYPIWLKSQRTYLWKWMID